ncbi:hypothetical protein OAP90_01070 [Nitrosopumilus sp.]|nr:hypothetical protein [Nitrosopumilus sp.]|tara:strand:- start:9 stop:995 length:987 start_codon:yes stop_codon:yes gene_type:complete
MNKIIITSLMVLALAVIPIADAQFGTPAYQKLTQLTIDESENIQAKHVTGVSNSPVSVNLFEGAITDSITVTNEEGKELEFGITNMTDYGAVTIFSPHQSAIVKYDLKNMFREVDNLLTLNIGYPKTFSILFSEKTELIFLNDQIIQLGDKKGISINTGGYVNVDYYDKIPKIIEEVTWEENKFDVEIITDSQIDEFSFDQETRSISFQVNEKNKFVTLTMEEELLGNSYGILLNNEKIKYSKSINKENHISLSIKPQAVGEIIISNSEYIRDLTQITSNDTLPVESISNDTLPVESISNDYFIWLVFGGVLIIVLIVVIIIMRKIKK